MKKSISNKFRLKWAKATPIMEISAKYHLKSEYFVAKNAATRAGIMLCGNDTGLALKNQNLTLFTLEFRSLLI